MKKIIAGFALLLGMATIAGAADSLRITLNRQNFRPGDTISWRCDLDGFDDSYKLCTLQVQIEDIKSSRSWQYRFPVAGMKSSGTMLISSEIPEGKYALNFLLQKDFFTVRGRASNYPLGDTAIDYLVQTKQQTSVLRSVPIYAGGRFSVGHMLFSDTALFVFSAPKAYDNFSVRIVTPLDSAFEPAAVVTKIIRVSQLVIANPNLAIPTAPGYTYDYRARAGEHLLDNVIVRGKRKTQAEEYAEQYVSAPFKSINDITFDGLESDEIGKSIDIFTFLEAKVAGLTVSSSGGAGTPTLSWRGGTPDLYLNEQKVGADVLSTINPEDVAQIKVFRPGEGPLTGGFGSGAGGAVAVYLRRGAYYKPSANAQNNRFRIRGYDLLDIEWR